MAASLDNKIQLQTTLYKKKLIVRSCAFRSSHRGNSVKKCVLKNFGNFTGKHLCRSLFLIKLQACNFVKKRLQHKCFPVKFTKFLITFVLKKICERLLLYIQSQSILTHLMRGFHIA